MAAPHPLNLLIFVNGDSNDGPLLRRTLAAASHAHILAADGGARQAQFYGLPVHTLIGDMDSLDAAEVTALMNQGAAILRYPEEKNETDLELALLWAAGQGAQWIRILCAIGDRLDQTLSNVYLMALPALRGLDVRMVSGKQEAWLAFPGQANVIQGQPGDTVSLLPLNGRAAGVRTENLYYPLRGETLAFGPARGLSNMLQSDSARVWLDDGLLLVVYTLGRA